ncbi:hypothetical protein [Deinococcus sp.]|uniref:hypothetical protein n=1 Tax=Deinococcus sp. TaxID=47478 RepID=UPI003B5BCC6F
MSDKLDNNAPLMGITPDDMPKPESEDSTLLGRLVSPSTYENETARPPGESHNIVSDLVAPLLGEEGSQRDPDAQDTTENSEG